MTALAATTPSVGAANSFAILAGTYSNSSVATTINGDIGFSTGPATHPAGVQANYGAGSPTGTARTDAGNALTNLNNQLPCDFNFPAGPIDVSTDGPNGATGIYPPGIYCSTGAMNIGVGGITLNGAGTFIFRADGALTSTTGSTVTIGAGASSCDVFWTPTAATTLAANTSFAGTIIDNANAITINANTTVDGRALSLGAGVVTTGSTVTINAPTCSLPPAAVSSGTTNNTITVIKNVINDNGGTATFSDFPLFINGNPVTSGQSVPLTAGSYTVTETNLPNYAGSFSGDCNASGVVDHGGIGTHNDVCILTNNDIGAPVVVPPVPPLIDVVKVPSPLALPSGPGSVTYTYTLKNIGTVPVSNVTMIDDSCSPTLVSGDSNNDAKLDLTETWTYKCTTNLVATHTNTVVASGWANGLSASDVATATVVVGVPALVPPLIHVTKIPSPLTLPAAGGSVTYTEKITNPGTVPLSNVTLADDKCSPMVRISGDANSDGLLDPSETWTYTCKSTLTKTTTNTAIATGSANGFTVRDLAIATVVVATAAVPTLPNTGIAPMDSGFGAWRVVAASLFAVAIVAYVAKKKRSNS